MAEIIPFGKPQATTATTQENNRENDSSLFFKLPPYAQEKINELLRMVKNSTYSKDSLTLEKTKIKTWSEEQLIDFCSNKNNYQELQQKPALVMAIAGRLLGMD